MSRSSLSLAAALAVSLSACGDATGPITLTAAEAALLQQDIAESIGRGINTLVQGQATIGQSIDCTGGGSATFNGSGQISSTGESVDATVKYSACHLSHHTADGSIRALYSFSANAGQASTTSTTVTGDVTVTVLAGGRAGTCHLDYTITLAPGSTTGSGTICGVATSVAVGG